MILIEIISEENNQMFAGIPMEFHKDLSNLYNKTIKHIINKPQFVKVHSLELVKKMFIINNFKSYDAFKVIDDFTDYYYELEKKDIEKIRFGFLEDIEEFLLEYLMSNDLLFYKND